MRETVLAAVLVLATMGCRQTQEQAATETLETEEVRPAVDRAVTTDYDVQARSTEESVGARMPADFPGDVPLYRSSSLIGQGPVEPHSQIDVFKKPICLDAAHGRVIKSLGIFD